MKVTDHRQLTLEEKRQLLAQLMKEREAGGQVYPMSYSQQRLWVLDRLYSKNASYHVEAAIPIHGQFDTSAAESALNAIIRRHAVLRTVFREIDGEPCQIVQPELKLHLAVTDLSHCNADERQERAEQIIVHSARDPYDLATGPLIRTHLIRLQADDYVFVLGMHHIVSDGWSMGILSREFEHYYLAYLSGQPQELPPLPIQYADYAVWQRHRLSGQILEDSLRFWNQTLTGFETLDMPTDRPRPAVPTFRGAYHEFTLPPSLRDQLQSLSKSSGATLFMTLAAAFAILLQRYCAQDRIAIGTYIANRTRIEVEPLIGFFLNTLVFPIDLTGSPTFVELLERVRKMALDVYAHQDLPFELLVQELQPERDLSRNPLVQVAFQLQNTPTTSHQRTTPALLDYRRASSIFDMSMLLFESSDGLTGQIEYSVDLFHADSIARFADTYRRLLQSIVETPQLPVECLSIQSPDGPRSVLCGECRSASVIPDSNLYAQFDRIASSQPDSVAFGTLERTFTYAELASRVDTLSRQLVDAGVRSGDVVAVFSDRGINAPAALLTALRLGAIYLPLDTSYPLERLEYMLVDAGAKVVVTDSEIAERLAEKVSSVIDTRCLAAMPSSALLPIFEPAPESPAYIIYTSGSTGKPKGVLGPHGQILNRLEWMWRTSPLEGDDLSVAKTSLSFVDSLWELLGPLLQGSPCLLVPNVCAADPGTFIEVLSRWSVTRIWLVPSMLRSMLDWEPKIGQRLPKLRFWVATGEPLPTELVMRMRVSHPEATLYNLYGTSEVWDATWQACDAELSNVGYASIGRPIDNICVAILDRNQQPVPVGVPGELGVSGEGVAIGYLHQPELTREKFVELTMEAGRPQRFYCTGDRARCNADGTIEVLGRIDQQVKVRGYRVELTEVENLLRSHADVRDAAVIERLDGAASVMLAAFVVPIPGRTLSAETLRAYAASQLPAPIVPSVFVVTDALPRTPSGKIDRRVLKAQRLAPQLASQGLEPARNDLEQALLEVWKQLLNVQAIGVNSNFFELGGHSLLAVQVVARLRKKFGVDISLRQLFEAPTPAGLASAIEAALNAPSALSAAPANPIVRLARVPRNRSNLS